MSEGSIFTRCDMTHIMKKIASLTFIYAGYIIVIDSQTIGNLNKDIDAAGPRKIPYMNTM